MLFPVSGVEVSPAVPVVVGFVIAFLTTPAGVSGAFLLMPFQLTVLNFTSPGVTPTNLLFNIISTPGGIIGFIRQGNVDRSLILWIVRGAVPGVVLGAGLRVSVFDSPTAFKAFVGIVLLGLGCNLLVQAKKTASRSASRPSNVKPVWISILGAAAGVVGGIYGISGGSIVAPALVGLMGLPVGRVAPAALTATFVTSIAGVVSFEIIDALSTQPTSQGPDWFLALLFGLGGAAGGSAGARLNKRVPEGWLRASLGVIALVVGATYLPSFLL